jgi:hypothetical protein
VYKPPLHLPHTAAGAAGVLFTLAGFDVSLQLLLLLVATVFIVAGAGSLLRLAFKELDEPN